MADVRYSRTARMLDDPDLGGDLLLAGLAFARFLDFGGIPVGQRLSTTHVAEAAWPGLPKEMRERTVKRVLAQDARTYQAPLRYGESGRRCGAPMVRRDGPCGRASTWSRLVTDWETGEQWWLLACARHVQWYDDTARANRETKPDTVPLPTANHGGVLARHILEFGWPKIWTWATNGQWVEHPEANPWKKPTLTLHVGDGDAGGNTRPMLGLVQA